MFLSTIILGHNSLSQNIDVCFCLLIDELKQLWSSETLINDVLRKQIFQMKVVLMWTINDITLYGIISGWSTHEKLACPYYMKNNKAFTLINGSKIFFLLLLMIFANE